MARRKDIDDFLGQKRIAVVGMSRDPKKFANMVYGTLKDRGYKLYPVNPNASKLGGETCYPSVEKLPEPVDGVLVMVQPSASLGIMQECAAAGISRVWLGNGSVSPEAVQYGKEHGMSVVDGECPMMFAAPVSFGHACHRFFKQITGTLPK